MGKVGRKKLVVPFPGLRVRDCLRVTAVLDLCCPDCWHTESMDVIALACGCRQLDQRIIHATRSMPCAHCGCKGRSFNVVAGPSLMVIDITFSHVIEPVYRIIARCWACHRSRELNPMELGRNRAIGPDARLADLEERLRCDGCGHRGWVRIRLEC